ncbi:MAG: C40 family peptidase [Mobilicoccus sp.]|nr:C40 family peptidase [Mobilicoccus sp.]
MKTLFKAAPARLAVTGSLVLALSGGFSAAVATPAATAAVSAAPTAISAAQGAKAVSIAATKRGTPYRWGATGPNAFDCSGFTTWTFARVGKKLPRTADQQFRASHKINRNQARPGDLVFYGGARKHHVGIYAGNGRMWHSPRAGKTVELATIRSGASYGRVR